VELRKKSAPRIKTRMVSDTERKIYTLLAFAIPLILILVFGLYRLNKRRKLAPGSAS
jgi:hypothetical protein